MSSTIQTQIQPLSAEFRSRSSEYQTLIDELDAKLARSFGVATEELEALQRKRNKLLTDERIERLADPGTPILDLCSLAGIDMYDGVEPGAGLRTAVCSISGRLCMVVANNPTVKGGTYFPMTVKKHLRAQEIAQQNKLPCVYLVDSGGAFLPLQAEVFPDREHFGRIFFNQANMSALGIPQISIVLGSCTAGGAYVPAMSDETVMVRGNATIFLGGPPLVKAATGEEVSAEELGGAVVHTSMSGVADHLAENEFEALERGRRIVASLGPDRITRNRRERTPEPPLYAPAELGGIVGTDLRKNISALEIIARIVDGSRFEEFKANYAQTIKCGFAHIDGFRVGIIANDGILFSESALKAAHFIELCNQRLTPIVFLQNIVGFMVGKEYENRGIAKDGAKLVTAVSTCRVPKYTVIVGGSFGAGNYAMCGRAYQPHFLFTWPNSRISVMGGPQAANVLAEVRFGGKKQATPQEIQEAYRDELLEKYEREGSPYYATARIWDDGIIAPSDTRTVLSLALASSALDVTSPYTPGVFRF